MKLAPSLGLAALVLTPLLAAPPLPPPPDTPRRPVADTYHGVKVSEDYRWLEDSADPSVKAWSEAQNARSRAYLDALPCRKAVQEQAERILKAGSVSYIVTDFKGGRFFAWKIDPKRQQPMAVTLASPDDPASERIVVDPNALDAQGAIAMDWFEASPDGRTLAVSLSRGGSESGDLHFFDVASGKESHESIPHVQNGTAGGSMAFAPDGAGFWYTRYPRGSERAPEDMAFYQQVWFHRFGTPAEKDACELGSQLPRIAECQFSLKRDGRWLLVEVKNGDGGEAAYWIRPTGAGGAWRRICRDEDQVVQAAFGRDDSLYLLSRKGAPQGKVLRLPLKGALSLARATEVVKPSDGAIQAVVPTRSRLYVLDLLGGPSRIRTFTLAGKPLPQVPLPPVSSASDLLGLEGDDLLFQNSSYLVPRATYRFDAARGRTQRTALAQTSPADFSDAEVVREMVKGKDGARIPLNILRKRGTKLDGNLPVLLYAYGGFGVSETPRFWSVIRIWLDHGGVFADASIRGGGEFGDQWHQDGKLLKKQNCFDDFAACARWLETRGYTRPDKLAIMGGSNGGLLMGAVLTEQPSLCRAVVSEVGIYDMLRAELTSNGSFNVTEYGTTRDPAQFKALLAYSPLHNVRDGVKYPAVLLATGANDPRVEPWHSRKFCARLQAASASGLPVLLRTSDKAGHGIGSSLDETIALWVDNFSFLIDQLGMR